MFFSTRKRTGRVQSKGAQRSLAASLLPSSSKKAFLGCFVALCVAVVYALDGGYWDSIMGPADGRIIDSDPKELDGAIEKALGKDRRELGLANRVMKIPFDAQAKEGKTGQVNARVAGHLLQNYFAADGWRVQGLAYQAMRPTSAKGLHDALQNVAVLKNLAPGVHDALQRRATLRGGFTLKQITGLAAVIKGKLSNEGQVTTVLRMLYRRHNLSFDGKIHQGILENITGAYLSHLNVVDTYAEAVAPALQPSTVADLRSKALEHAYILAARSSGKLRAESNFTSPNYSSHVVSVMAENLTRAFERRYIADHCENVGRLLRQAAPKGTGRLRLSTFYSQVWNETLNYAEPKRHLRLAGALDESDKEQDTPRVLAANYVQGHLNCVRHSQYYSLCCPNQCASIMQSIETSIKAPVGTPQELLDAFANISSPRDESPLKLPAPLVAKLYEISERHNGAVPLHGRLFAQWLHYTFPNECPYPHEKDVEMKKVRLTEKDVSKQDKEEIAWASVTKGFDVPATRLHTAPWSETEVLPLRADQVWSKHSAELRDIVRLVACVLVVIATVRMIHKVTSSSQVNDDAKLAFGQLPKDEGFESRLKTRVELLRFEYTVELTPDKCQEQTKIGLQLQPTLAPQNGLVVEEILPGGLLHVRNEAIMSTKRIKTVVGDHLVSVNGKTSPHEMVEELSMLSRKTSLRFSRESSRAAPLIWTADLERMGNEQWGVALSEVAESQSSKELTISRVVAGGPVDKWNRRAIRKNKNGIYPGDIILGCSPELDCKKVLAKLQTEKSLELTILRWNAADDPNVPPKGLEKIERDERKAPQRENSDQPHNDVAEEVCAIPTTEIEEQRCACCDAVITDKFVVTCCNAGDWKYYRRTCWRQKHGGFTIKHVPRHCTCGSPLAKVEVFERSSPTAEPRLVHTILDGPIEVDVRMDDVPEQEDRATGNAQRRGASAARRAIDGDARRRAASIGRRRSSPERSVEQDAEQAGREVDEPFFRPRRLRDAATVAFSSSEETSSSRGQLPSTSDSNGQQNICQSSLSAKAEVSMPVSSKVSPDATDRKAHNDNSCKRTRTPPRELKRSLEEKTCGAANVSARKQQPEKSRPDDVKFEVDPWFLGADPWDVEEDASEGKAEPSASVDKKKDPWFAAQGADPWGVAKNKSACGKTAEGAHKLTDHTSSKHADKEEDPWFGAGTDPWSASKQRHDKKEDPWFVLPDADPWKQAPHRNQTIDRPFQMTCEGDVGEAGRSSARASSRALASSTANMNPLVVDSVPGGRSLPALGLLLPQPPPPPLTSPPTEPANIKLPDLAQIGLRDLALESASIRLRDPPPGLPVPTFPSDVISRKVTAPPGLSLVDAPPGLDAPVPLGVLQLDEPFGLSAPPGLPEAEVLWPIRIDAFVQGIEQNEMEMDEASIKDAGRANKTNRWNKNKHGACD